MNTDIKLTFGRNPYDRCPHDTGRYHVVDQSGFIRAKAKYGYTANDIAGNLSDKEIDLDFWAIDTRDNTKYGGWRNGAPLD